MEDFYDKPGFLINEHLDELEIQHQFEFQWIQEELTSFKVNQLKSNDTNLDFIGAHPISLQKAKLAEIKKNPADWLVCEKTDGVRYLLIILNNGHAYLTGRNVGSMRSQEKRYQLMRINFSIPVFMLRGGDLAIQYLFDGELICDKFRKKPHWNYLIFDTLINVKPLIEQNGRVYRYIDRLKAAQEYLSLRKFSKAQNGPLNDLELRQLANFPKIKCMLKDFYPVTKVRYLINNYIPILPHLNDGLIFTQNSMPYKQGTCEFICKWKPPDKNSIDLFICQNQIIPVKDPNQGLLEYYVVDNLYDQRQLVLFDMAIVSKAEIDLVNLTKVEVFKRQQELGIFEPVEGVVAECTLKRKEQAEEKTRKLFDPATWRKTNQEIPEVLGCILENSNLAQQHAKNQKQIRLLQEVREQIQLRSNFKYFWNIEKFRTDKTNPNASRVARNLIEVINEVNFILKYNFFFFKNLTEQELINEIESIYQ